MMPNGTDLFNSSVEEGLFPNIPNYQPITVPSYERDYDYGNEYNNPPLVYSWLPIVPGFTQDGFDNLHNFQHLADKFNDQQSFNVSDSSEESGPIPNQNIKYKDYLTINNPDPKLPDNYNEVKFHELENSCNAILSVLENAHFEEKIAVSNLSFTGKITELVKAHEKSLESVNSDEEIEDSNSSFTEKITELVETHDRLESEKKSDKLTEHEVEQTEEERLHNESFEILKKEDSSLMLYVNERSPDLFDSNGDILSDEPREEVEVVPEMTKSADDCCALVLNKMKNSLAGRCPPPPKVTKCQMSMSEILATYNKNLKQSPSLKSTLKTNSFFVPSHLTEEVKTMEWPSLLPTKCLDVSYNKSIDNEEIEDLFLRYVDRYVGAETSSSFNHKIGPLSAKKKNEKLK